MKKLKSLEIEEVYSKLAIFFLATALILLNDFPKLVAISFFPNLIQFATNIQLGFYLLAYFLYGFLAADFLVFYLIKSFSFFRKRYEKYKNFYWIGVATVLLIILGIVWFFLYGLESLIQVILSTLIGVLILGIIALVVKIIKDYYDKKLKKK